MTAAAHIAQRGRALLIQAMERRWPGCGAHTKRGDLVWSDLLAPAVQREISSFVSGWSEGLGAAVRILQEDAPFESADLPAPAPRQSRQHAAGKPHGGRAAPAMQGVARRDDRAAAARAGLESLFSGEAKAGGDDAN